MSDSRAKPFEDLNRASSREFCFSAGLVVPVASLLSGCCGMLHRN